jgi:diguanylate cyclase (GGDEF)-like protein
LLRFENRILRLIANGAPVQDTAHQLCHEVEAFLPGVICTVMTVDPAGLLDRLAAPSLPAEFSAAIRGVMKGPDVGSCGTAAYMRQPVFVTDIANDPKWAKFKDLALAADLRACWSAPIAGHDGEAVGALALYFREPRIPLEHERSLIAQCVELCEIALRRHERVADRERRASIDALTGLPNRAAFNMALASMARDEPGSWALFIVDLDNLKTINDTFGHPAGDGLIRAAGERVAAAMLPDITFRLGGDEFAVLVQYPEALTDLDARAGKIFAALETPADCDGHAVVPAATIGGAVLAATNAAADVYQNADFALYHAKETGRGGFVRYWPGIGSRITHRRDAIRDVSAALAEGRIDAYYQPIVRLDTREIVGVEALCRLRTTDGEVVAASEFQEATSDVNVAAELTGRMLSIVAGDVRAWLDAGLPFQAVGVNVSTGDFYAGDLMRKLEHSFGRAGVSLEHLFLEVNENVSAGRRDKVIAREIGRIRRSGVRVSLDDFGTGQASLTHLVSMPVDAIKIDRSFVAQLWPDDPAMVLVQGLIEIARQLNVHVVAEGIETEVQASQLWTMGCVLGQGFEFSRAVDRAAMTELLRQHAEGVEGAIPLASNIQPALSQLLPEIREGLRTGTR